MEMVGIPVLAMVVLHLTVARLTARAIEASAAVMAASRTGEVPLRTVSENFFLDRMPGWARFLGGAGYPAAIFVAILVYPVYGWAGVGVVAVWTFVGPVLLSDFWPFPTRSQFVAWFEQGLRERSREAKAPETDEASMRLDAVRAALRLWIGVRTPLGADAEDAAVEDREDHQICAACSFPNGATLLSCERCHNALKPPPKSIDELPF